MKTKSNFIQKLAAAGILSIALSAHAAWPEKASKWIVPFPPGGAMDAIARALGEQASRKLGQPVVIENRPGAGGNIGLDAAAKSPADGHTWVITSVGMVTNKYLYPKLSYDPQKDFAPVTMLATVSNVLVVNPQKIKAQNVKELIAEAKSQPGKLTYASAGNGTSIHLAGELFAAMTDTQMVHVPYRGSGPAMTDLLGGQVDMMFDSISSARPYIQAGKLKALGVTTRKKSSSIPDIPTIEQAGVANYELLPWFGVFVPTGTPNDVVKKIQSTLDEGMKSTEVKARMFVLGAEPAGLSGAAFSAYLVAESQRWAKIIRERSIKAD
jgi:tripartite-type tricarboxylate transporter receptor subunit TctC